MIRLNVFVLVENLENKKALIDAAVELVEKSRHDAGVVAYDLFASLTVDKHLMICETWKDEVSLQAHQETEHFKRLVGRMEELGTMKLERFDF